MTWMKRIVATWLIVSAASASAEKPTGERPIDIVVDIDGVLAFVEGRSLPMDVQRVLLDMGVLVVANGKIYRLAHGAGAFLQSLSHISGSRISFFSAHGRTGRTAEILGKIVLPNGKSAWDIAHNILFGPSVLNVNRYPEEDQERFRPTESVFRTLRGGEREQKKDLTKVDDDVDLSRTILIDDLPTNVLKGQEKNFLWCRFHHGPVELVRIRGLIDRAVDEARASGRPLADVLWELQWTTRSREEGSGVLEFDGQAAYDDVVQRGFKKLRKEFPSFSIDAPYLGAVASGRVEDALRAQHEMVTAGTLPKFPRRKPLDGPVPPDESERRVRAALELPPTIIPLPARVEAPEVLDPAVVVSASSMTAAMSDASPSLEPAEKKRRGRWSGCITHLVEAVRSLVYGARVDAAD